MYVFPLSIFIIYANMHVFPLSISYYESETRILFFSRNFLSYANICVFLSQICIMREKQHIYVFPLSNFYHTCKHICFSSFTFLLWERETKTCVYIYIGYCSINFLWYIRTYMLFLHLLSWEMKTYMFSLSPIFIVYANIHVFPFSICTREKQTNIYKYILFYSPDFLSYMQTYMFLVSQSTWERKTYMLSLSQFFIIYANLYVLPLSSFYYERETHIYIYTCFFLLLNLY